MFLCGEIISVEECNFESSRDYGLICPLCSEAVFIRSGGLRNQTLRNGKKRVQFINPYFAHYHTGVEFQSYCENRAHTKEGRDRVEQLKIEAKNQRLKLYNHHLWEMFQVDRNVRSGKRKQLIREFGKDFFVAIAVRSRETWADRINKVYEEIEDWASAIAQSNSLDELADYYGMNQHRLDEMYGFPVEDEFHNQSDYFQNHCDLRVHKAIVSEIADFLTTRTSGFFWENFVQAWAFNPHVAYRFSELMKSPSFPVSMGTSMLCSTHWVDQINRRLK